MLEENIYDEMENGRIDMANRRKLIKYVHE